MSINFFRFLIVLFLGSSILFSACGVKNTSLTVINPNFGTVGTMPSPTPAPRVIAKGKEVAVFAGGCFWGVEAVFESIKGVDKATSGYSGGAVNTANYESVSNGDTGHAEAVEIIYDSSQVSYAQLLKVFFSVTHDPTELNRQGPDTGTQYRSAIFYTTEEQKHLAESYIAELMTAKVFQRPIVTQITALEAFYPAEDYHQDYLVRHPMQPYILMYDRPKVATLQKQFPELYVLKEAESRSRFQNSKHL